MLLWLVRSLSTILSSNALFFTNGTMWEHPGWACLRASTPSLDLRYPDDAEAHYVEIHRRLAPWSQPPGHKPHEWEGFRGPWVENLWISHAREVYPLPNGRNGSLADVFGPFIPILVTWVDIIVSSWWRYPQELIDTLRSVLRPTVPYVTVSQNDEGVTGRCELLMKDWPNLLVLSSGGYGHVPIPLFTTDQELNNAMPMASRPFVVSFVGSLEHAPSNFRERVKAVVLTQSARLNFTQHFYKGPDWKKVMQESRVSLVPRGYGRTAYHLAETIQMGLIPLYVYSDVPWIPYPHIFEKIGYSTSLERLSHTLQHLVNTPVRVLEEREQLAMRYRPLFQPGTIIDQIFRFLNTTHSELRCVGLPPTVRDSDAAC